KDAVFAANGSICFIMEIVSVAVTPCTLKNTGRNSNFILCGSYDNFQANFIFTKGFFTCLGIMKRRYLRAFGQLMFSSNERILDLPVALVADTGEQIEICKVGTVFHNQRFCPAMLKSL